MNFKNDCYECIKLIKDAPYFPFKEGHLKNEYTGIAPTNDGYVISFEAPYVVYLEEGVLQPYDIPHAFGYGSIYPDRANPYTHKKPFGVGGRFNGRFHPAMTRHKDFIKVKCVNEIINYFVNKYKGVLK